MDREANGSNLLDIFGRITFSAICVLYILSIISLTPTGIVLCQLYSKNSSLTEKRTISLTNFSPKIPTEICAGNSIADSTYFSFMVSSFIIGSKRFGEVDE